MKRRLAFSWLAALPVPPLRPLLPVLILLLTAVTASAAQGETADERTLVMPFENVQRDASIFWLGEASAVVLGDELNALGTNAITRPERLHAFERLQVPAAASLTDATVIRIGQLVGAAQVIVGSLEVTDGTLVVHARSIALSAGRVQVDLLERGPLPDMFAVFDRVARRLVPMSGRAEAAPEHPPVAAFENYIKGLLAKNPSTAANFLKAALTASPEFDRARLALWDVYVETGAFDQAIAVVEAVPAASPWSRQARFRAGLAELQANQLDRAFTTLKALSDERPVGAVLNNLGVVQLRRGGSSQAGVPAYYFDKAVQAEPDDPDYYFNLGYTYWQLRDTAAAIYWLREAVRRSPADGVAHFVLGAALAAGGGSPIEATREKDLAKRLSSTYEQWDKRPGPDAVPKGLERLKTDVDVARTRQLEIRLQSTEQRSQQELAKFYLERGRRLFVQDSDREAMAELDRALFLSPYLAEAHLLVGRIHLRNGRTREAIEALKISLWSEETADGHALLGEAYLQSKDISSARNESDRALALDPSSVEANRLLDMLKSL